MESEFNILVLVVPLSGLKTRMEMMLVEQASGKMACERT